MASSSSRSGVHIQVTTGRPLTSSQTGTSSTAADSDILPPRLAGCCNSVDSGTVGIEGGVLRDAYPLQNHPLREAGCDAGKQMNGERLASRQGASRGEVRNILVQVFPGQRGQDFFLKDSIQQTEIHDHARIAQVPADGDGAPVIVFVSRWIGQRTEDLAIAGLAPLGAIEPVPSVEAHR